MKRVDGDSSSRFVRRTAILVSFKFIFIHTSLKKILTCYFVPSYLYLKSFVVI